MIWDIPPIPPWPVILMIVSGIGFVVSAFRIAFMVRRDRRLATLRETFE